MKSSIKAFKPKGMISMAASKESKNAWENAKELACQKTGLISKSSYPMTVAALEHSLLAVFPADDAEVWDRTGMTVGDSSRLISGVAVALDATVAAIDMASSAGANVLVTHHPAYLNPPDSFKPMSSTSSISGSVVWHAIYRSVALMSFHTALDVSVSAQRILPGMLGFEFQRVLLPIKSCAAMDKGYGQLCNIRADESLSLGQLAARCTSVFARSPRVWGNFSQEITTVVTCTGSAGQVGRAALEAHADCLVCGEIKYHDALDLSQAGLAVVDLGHDVSELPLVSVLASAVRDAGIPDELVFAIDQRDNWKYPDAMRV